MSDDFISLKDSDKYQVYGDCLACLGYFAFNAGLCKRADLERELAECTRLNNTPTLKGRLNWWNSKLSNIQYAFFVNNLNGVTLHGLNVKKRLGKGRPSHPRTQARIKRYALSYFLNDLERCKRYAKLYLDTKFSLSILISSALFDIEGNLVNENFLGDQEAVDELRKKSPEGAKRLVTHLRRERDSVLARNAKVNFTSRYGRLFCQACGVVPLKVYGVEVIEAHHRIPLSKSEEGRVTEIADLIMLCPSCHRAVHRIEDCDFAVLKAKFD